MTETFPPFDEKFISKYPVVRFRKGDIILKYGQLNTHLYCIKEGICACTIINTDGNTLIPLFLRKHEVIGVRLELLGVMENRSIHEVSAHTDVAAYKIPINDIRTLLKTDFEAYKRATRSVISSLDRVIETSNLRGKGNSVMMVCNTIYHEMEPVPGKKDLFILPSYFSVTDLANSMLIHRVTVSRIMHTLCMENVMKKEDRCWYITDASLLNKYRQGMLTLKIKK
ncbi:MAG: Crp/Fnr family transcriptional regulator [Parasporobacterium sp.]|nr:Crp/Fnr family transcriptional regulator [Parasporobacterium sp.]